MIKWFTILLAVCGLALGIWTVSTSGEKLPRPAPARPPSVNPFDHGIAATGLIEAASRNIVIGVPEQGLVVKVCVEVNEAVQKDQPLFELDRRSLEAEQVRAAAAVEVAEAELFRVKSLPRAEDLPPLEAAVTQAKTTLAELEDLAARTKTAFESKAATPWEDAQARYRADAARAALATAQANLARARAGAWAPELASAKARVDQARAELAALKLRIERLTVRSPIDGVVLQRNIEPGEFGSTGPGAQALVLGDISKLHVRAKVDEEDAPLLRSGARGVARLRGAVLKEYPLRMIRIEPWAQAKSQLSGATTERVDTRVVDAVFEVERDARTDETPLFLSQMVDVFIEAPAATTQP